MIYGTYTENGGIIRTSDGLNIPADPDNMDYRAAMQAVAAGATITPYAALVPSTNPSDYQLTKRQVCAALILAGVTDDPDTFVMGVLNTIPDARAKALAINDWRNAPYYTRDNALFNDPSLLGASGITPEQVDQFWLLGAQQPA